MTTRIIPLPRHYGPASQAKKAALLLAAYTRNDDFDDRQFEAAASNAAFYYGIDVQSALKAFDGLTALEFWGGQLPSPESVKGAAWE